MLLFLWFRFLLGQENDVVNVFVDPWLGVTQGLLVSADGYASLVHALVLPAWLGEDVMHGFFGHATEQFLENTRHAELPLHQVADEHHQVLAEALEHEEVSLYIVHVAYVLLDGCVDFLEESIWQSVDFNQHLLALRLFGDTQLVVQAHLEGSYHEQQVGYRRKVEVQEDVD